MNRLTVQDFTQYRFLSQPAFSPDGKSVAFVAQQADLEKNGYTGDLWVITHEEASPRRLTTMGDAKSFLWQDDRTLLFAAQRDQKRQAAVKEGDCLTTFYAISLQGGEAAEAFTIPLAVKKLQKVDGGRYLVTATFDNTAPDLSQMSQEDKQEYFKAKKRQKYTVFDELPFWSNGQGITNKKRTRLYLYEAATGRLSPITPPYFETGAASLRGTRLVYAGAQFVDLKGPTMGLYCCDLDTLQSTCLVPDGRWMIGAVDQFEDAAVVAASEGLRFGGGENPGIYTYTFATGEFALLGEFDMSVGGSSVGSDSKLGGGRTYKAVGDRFYFVTTNGDYSYLRCVDRQGNLSPALTQDGSVESFDLAGDLAVVSGFRGNHLSALYALSLQNGTETKLTALNDAFEASHEIVTPRPLNFVDNDGVEIHGWVMLPPGFDPQKKYPGILHVHGGPKTVFSSVFHHEMQLWAAQGYVVFYCNPRGSDGRGNQFADLRGKYGTIDYEDCMAFTDAVLARYPQVDPKRLAIAGGSYGGFMANWAIGHTDRFAAAVSQRCVTNWFTMQGASDIGSTFVIDQVGGDALENVDKVWEQSPLKYACNAKTPTLFIHSDQDYRCFMAEGIQMFTALKLHQVPARLCLFKGENHELSRSGKPLNRIKRMQEILGWFEQYLR